MQAEELQALVERVRKLKFESRTLEIKSAHLGCPTKLYPVLSGFSNQDDGGVILFGLDEEKGFELTGVYDPQDLQKRVVEQCGQMEPAVRPLFTFCEINEKIVVSTEIPSADILIRPVYYKGVGRIKGSFVRIGASNESMNEYEIYSYDAYRKHAQDDLRKAENAKLTFFDQERMEMYLKTIKKERRNLADSVSDDAIMEMMGVILDGVPTIAGLMSFSKYPQGYFPQLCVTAVSLPGTEMGETGDEGERFIDNRRITGAIPDMIEEAMDFVRINSRGKTIVDNEGKRRDKLEYPIKAIREAVLNGLVHRDYSVHTQNVPVRIEMYRDRLEVISPGGLYGKITIDCLGKTRPDTRNAVLANILELLGVTENRYSGIPTIRSECRKAGIPTPLFQARRGEFIVTFKNNIYVDQAKKNWQTVQNDLLDFCAVPRTRAEVIEFAGFSKFYTMNNIVQPLIDKGALKMSIPAKPKSPKQTYESTGKLD